MSHRDSKRRMEPESEISLYAYHKRYGHLKFFDSSSNPPPKKMKYSPTTNLIKISDSSTKKPMMPLSHMPPLPETFKLSPTILKLLGRPNNERKRSRSSSSIVEITKRVFEAAVEKSSSTLMQNIRAVKSSSWVKTKLLGKGGYGSVHLATRKDDESKTERAIKSAEILSSLSLIHEGTILERLQSQYVVACYGDEIVKKGKDHQYNLILEYCSGSSLADLITINHGGLPEFDVKIFSRDILYGLSYIHKRDIIHCDIKPDNLLLSPVDQWVRCNGYVTKIADFGLAMEKGSTEYGDGSGHKRGTTRYMAPEVMSGGTMDFGVDIWGFGCTVLEMLTGKIVWAELGTLGSEDWVNLIGYSEIIPQIPSCLSEEAQDFLRKCFVKKPAMRWKIDALLNHPFLKLDEGESSHNGFLYDSD